jgi:hypothetical protein
MMHLFKLVFLWDRKRAITSIPFTAFVLCFSGSIVFATDQYGEWTLERPATNAIALSYRDIRPIDNVAELDFTCDRHDTGKIGAMLIPFEGTYDNQQDDVPVLVQKSAETTTPFDLSMKWRNGFKYIFLNDQDLMNKLTMYLKGNEANGTEYVHFFFSGDFNGRLDILNHMVINLSGFSDGFAALNTACKP